MNDGPSNKPPGLKRAALIIAALLLLAFLVVFVLASMQLRSDWRTQSVTMPDGGRLELLGTTAGTNEFTTERAWHRIARRLLPSRLQKWLPPVITGTCNSSSNNITIWVRLTPMPPMNRPPWTVLQTEDANGFRYPRRGGYHSDSYDPAWSLYSIPIVAFPRRQKDFLFHLVDAGGTDIATFRAQNPRPHSFPEWQPSALPQTKPNGPVALTLRSLVQSTTAEEPSVTPTWLIESPTNPAWTNARARNVTFLDAAGNEGPFLSPREKAWKLRTLVFRERLEDFATNETLVLTNLVIPAAGDFLPLNQSADRIGVRIEVRGLAGAGILTLSNGVFRSTGLPEPGGGTRGGNRGRGSGWSGHTLSSGTTQTETWRSSNPFLLVKTKDTLPDDEIQFRPHDEQGREIKVERINASLEPDGAISYFMQLLPADDAKSLDLTVVVNRPLLFEFLVNPAEIRPPKP